MCTLNLELSILRLHDLYIYIGRYVYVCTMYIIFLYAYNIYSHPYIVYFCFFFLLADLSAFGEGASKLDFVFNPHYINIYFTF